MKNAQLILSLMILVALAFALAGQEKMLRWKTRVDSNLHYLNNQLIKQVNQ